MNFLTTLNPMTLILTAVAIVLLLVWILKSLYTRNRGTDSIDDIDASQIYVGNLSYRVRERELREFFTTFGGIEKLRIIKNHDTGRSKGFGFITFNSKGQADKALKAHGDMLQGRAMVVRMAQARSQDSLSA